MKQAKKVISLAACVAIMLTTATASVFAEDTTSHLICQLTQLTTHPD